VRWGRGEGPRDHERVVTKDEGTSCYEEGFLGGGRPPA